MRSESDVSLRGKATITKEIYMKKLIALLVAMGLALASPVYGADDKGGSSLWENLRKKIEWLTPKKKISTTTAVGGVRGSQADAEEVYWKGEAKTNPIDEVELAAIKKAVALIDAGDEAGAKAAFNDFLKKFPDSRLKPDVEMALAQLQSKQ